MPHCILLLLSASMRVWLRRMAIPEPQEWTYKFPLASIKKLTSGLPPKNFSGVFQLNALTRQSALGPMLKARLLPALSFEQFLVSDPLRVFRVSDLQPICMLC